MKVINRKIYVYLQNKGEISLSHKPLAKNLKPPDNPSHFSVVRYIQQLN